MKKINLVLICAVALLLGGCASATKEFSKRLRGTWQIVNYNVERPDVRSVAGPASPNHGTITFNKDWTGSTDNGSIFDNLTSARSGQNQYRFKWSNTENIIILRAEGNNISKSWIVVTNKKDQQVWKSTDGANEVNTLELKR